MPCRVPGRWLTLALATASFLTSASACTVYDLYSSGLASSLWHMIPAVGLVADNGTFFVRPLYQLGRRCYVGQRHTLNTALLLR